MIASVGKAYTYFGAPAGGFLRWADNASVVVWSDGSTVEFREELVEILRYLEPGGIPPFRALLLLLAACRGKIPELPAALKFPAALGVQANLARVAAAHKALSQIPWLPKELLSSTAAKCTLAEVVFEGSGSTAEACGGVCSLLSSLNERLLNAAVGLTSFKDIEHALLDLHDGLQRVTVETLRARARTGLDTLPEPADLDQHSDGVNQLLKQLQFDPEQSGLAKVTRDIMAALYLPRPLSDPEELPLGGVSDITNRGTLDRLLLSELAHDDLTLSARIALNEALYIRREPPANTHATTSMLLLDVGLRMWGVPRLFATAAGLAILAKRQSKGHAWRARSGRRLEPANLFSREGLTEHLSILDAYAQPGICLPEFASMIESNDDADSFLITSRDAADDPDFKRDFAAAVQKRPFYVAVVDRQGQFELRWQTASGQKLLCQATIDLEQLFPKTPRTSVPLVRKEHDPNLPLILGLKPFPLLLPVRGKIERLVPTGDGGGIALMKDRRVLAWHNTSEGARTIVHSPSSAGATLWIDFDEEENVVHVARYVKGGRVSLQSLDCDSGEVVVHEAVVGAPPMRVHYADGALFLIHRQTADAFSIHSGELLGQIQIPAPYYVSWGKYFFKPGTGWCFLNFDGFKPSLDPVTMKRGVAESDIVLLFDRPGTEGPWILTKKLDVISATDGDAFLFGLPWQAGGIHVEVSDDGYRMLVSPGTTSKRIVLNLQNRTHAEIKSGTRFELNRPARVPAQNLRTRFTAIYAAPGEPLLLRTHKGLWMEFKLEPSHIELVTSPHSPSNRFKDRPFANVSLPRETPFNLQVAAWDNGSRAWLDSRGLLHLKSHEANLPEICVVLAEGSLAVWSSDGAACGPKFFLGSMAPVAAQVQFEKIGAFIDRCL